MAAIFRLIAGVTVLVLPISSLGAEAVPIRLDLAQVVTLASRAPETRLADARVAEAQAGLASADVLTRENPRFDAAIGPRSGSGTSADIDLGLDIPVEFGRRDKRVALAQAGISRERHAADNVRRESVMAAVAAYYAALKAEEQLRIVLERKSLAEELVRVAEERFRSGDGPRFEVNIARSELARAVSEISSGQGRVASAKGALAQRLGLPSADGFAIQGELKDRAPFDTLRSDPARVERPDLFAAAADVEAAKRAVVLAKAEQAPDWALRLNYRREGDENVAMAGVSVSLPFINRKTGPVLEARAAEERTRIAAETRRVAIATEIETALRAYDAATRSVRQMEDEALPVQRETESMALESYRSGKIGLAALLQVRRDAQETRKEYLDRLMEAAEAGIGLATAVGFIPAHQ